MEVVCRDFTHTRQSMGATAVRHLMPMVSPKINVQLELYSTDMLNILYLDTASENYTLNVISCPHPQKGKIDTHLKLYTTATKCLQMGVLMSQTHTQQVLCYKPYEEKGSGPSSPLGHKRSLEISNLSS